MERDVNQALALVLAKVIRSQAQQQLQHRTQIRIQHNAGPENNNQKCGAGKCCSGSGWCGTGENYCSDPENCQFNFGRCDSDNTPAGTSTINDPRPVLGKVTYDNDIYNCVEPGVVALTYDDGPYQYTNQMLDVLKQFGFKATFFMTGNNLAKGAIDVTAPYPAIVKRMIAEGHQVASHTWSHYDLSTLTHDQRVQQMVKNERAIANLIGKYPTYMRPPYSSCDTASGCQADMKALGYHRTYFDLDTQDYLHTTPVQVQVSKDIVREYLATTTKPDYLSIQHDIHQQSVANLSSYYFDQIKAKGWKGVTVGECLQDPEENWYRVPGTGQGAPVSHSTSSTTSKLIHDFNNLENYYNFNNSKPLQLQKLLPLRNLLRPPQSPPSRAPPQRKPPTSTSKTPQPTSSCIVHQGTFCGTIPAFIGHPACLTSLSSCEAQLKTCPAKAGSTTAGKAACSKYQGDCNRLRTYCGFCGGNCKSTNPRYRTFVLQETA